MKIERIHNNGYNKQGEYSSSRKSSNRRGKMCLKQPIDAITFDDPQIVEEKNKTKDEHAWLRKFIEDLPDEEVVGRIKKMIESFDSIEDCIVEKLIIEEI